ncbi:MAG: hypothetical protein AB8C02_19235 [Halioglobus sp.]
MWLVWLLLTAALSFYLYSRLSGEETDKTVFLPGATTSGHHQIEMVCTACHTGPYADRDALQEACEGCHLENLKAAKDDHPKSKFTDPRNADRIAVLDARYCVTCHVEHRPDITHAMGVTIPEDTCFLCHSDIAQERSSHDGMAFDTCTDSGCHNFHDNTALYEDFLIKHLDKEPILFGQSALPGNLREIAEQLPDYPLDAHPLQQANLEEQRMPADIDPSSAEVVDWLASSHRHAGVGCVACHESIEETGGEAAWIEKPTHTVCASCHTGEVAGFLEGKHGMRLDVERLGRELDALRPAMAMRPMKSAAHEREVNCQSCHSAHQYDTRTAVVESCLGCHNDEHSLAYKDSSHYALWQRELSGELQPGEGVTCASCHMPRIEKDYYWGTFVHNQVQHNQSATLQPNEKMLRPVCMECHGLEFAMDALADTDLINRNFAGKPAVHVQSMDLVRARLAPKPDANASTSNVQEKSP